MTYDRPMATEAIDPRALTALLFNAMTSGGLIIRSVTVDSTMAMVAISRAVIALLFSAMTCGGLC